MSISDIHYSNNNTPGEGHDTGDALLTVALDKFSQLSEHVDFILTLGDFPTHMLGYSPKKKRYMKTVFHRLYQADKNAKPMFFISGNNDPLRGNYQPFTWNNESLLTLATDWQGACAHCDGLIIDGTHMTNDGYYSSYVLPNNKDILLLVLNSTQFAKPPFFIPKYPHQDRDALQQLQWLEAQLKKHHAKQLLIAMHIPPGANYKGRPMWHAPYLKEFIRILHLASPQYDQITLLTSHTHMDDIRKIRLKNGKAIYAFATPSISREHYNYPALKVFELDNHSKLKDYTTYYTRANTQWGRAQYSAIKGSNSLFPQCARLTLNKCLDSQSDSSVCKRLTDGHFYGVKNPRVDGSVCKYTYAIF